MFNKQSNFTNPTKGGFTKETKNTFSHMDMISNDWDFDKDPNEEEEIDPVYLYDAIKPKATSYYSAGINRDGDYLSELAKGDEFRQRTLTDADYASVSSVHREAFLRNSQDIPRDTSGRPGANIQPGFGTNRLNNYYDDGYGGSVHEPERRTVPLFTKENFSDGTENITSSFDSDNYGDGNFDFNPFDNPVKVDLKKETEAPATRRLSSISYDNINGFDGSGFGGGNFDSGNFGGNFDSGNFGGGNFGGGNFDSGNFGGGNFGGGNFDSGNFGGNFDSGSFGAASYGSSNFSGMKNTTSNATKVGFDDLMGDNFGGGNFDSGDMDAFGNDNFDAGVGRARGFGSSNFEGSNFGGSNFDSGNIGGVGFEDLAGDNFGNGGMTGGGMGTFGSGSFVGTNTQATTAAEGFDLASAMNEGTRSNSFDNFGNDNVGNFDSDNFAEFAGGSFGRAQFAGSNSLSSGYEQTSIMKAAVDEAEDMSFEKFASEEEGPIIRQAEAPAAVENVISENAEIEEIVDAAELAEEPAEKPIEELIKQIDEEIGVKDEPEVAESSDVASAYGSTDYNSMYGTGNTEEAAAKEPEDKNSGDKSTVVNEEPKKEEATVSPVNQKLFPAFPKSDFKPAAAKEEPKKEEKSSPNSYKPGGIFSLDFGEDEDPFAHLRLHSNQVTPVARDIIAEINRFGESTPVEPKDTETKAEVKEEAKVEEGVEEAEEVVEEAEEAVEEVEETAEEVVEEAEETAEEVVEEVEKTTEEAVEEAEETAEEAVEEVEETAEEVVEETEETAEEAVEEIEETVEEVSEEVAEETVEETAEIIEEAADEVFLDDEIEEVEELEEITEEVEPAFETESVEEEIAEDAEDAVEELEEIAEITVEDAAEEVVEEEITESIPEEVLFDEVEEAEAETAEVPVEEAEAEIAEVPAEEAEAEIAYVPAEEPEVEITEAPATENAEEAAEEVVEEAAVEEAVEEAVAEPAEVIEVQTEAPKRKQKVVVSLGHEAIGGHTTLEQLDSVKKTSKVLADLIEDDYQLTITHSNGQQVSMIHKAMTELRRVYIDYTPAPMCVCSAMSQGYVGYDIQNSLRAELLDRGISKTVSTILTQVTVDPYDEAFYEPTKEIGRFMSADDAETEKKKGNYVKEYPGKGFRRVVAAPKPMDIVEIEAIRALANADQAVIACGGGGIPVIEQKHALKGASAVIEKDAIAGRLATELKSDILLIITGVDNAYTGFGTEAQTAIDSMTVAQAKDYIENGVFGAGTMLPKIEAAIDYLTAYPEGKVIITSLDKADEAVKGKAGTVITA